MNAACQRVSSADGCRRMGMGPALPWCSSRLSRSVSSRRNAGRQRSHDQSGRPSAAHSSKSYGMPRSAMHVFTALDPPTTRPRGKSMLDARGVGVMA
jgi:hypothetical protein